MKVYDCFTFFNEFELLELRLNIMKDIVDYFVIVEANKTHKNQNKEFNFAKRQEDFKEYLDKIIYIKVEDMPEEGYYEGTWVLENYQRNCIMRGLKNSQPDDLIIISDIDEIPNPSAITSLLENNCNVDFFIYNKFRRNLRKMIIRFPDSIFRKQYGINLLDRTPLAFAQDMFYYFVNCKSEVKWYGSIITKRNEISTPQKLRERRNDIPRIKNGGWHFSYLGGVERIMLKLNSIVESTANSFSPENIKHCIYNKLDLYGRQGKQFEYEFIEIDETMPKYIKLLIDKYPDLYFDDSESKK